VNVEEIKKEIEAAAALAKHKKEKVGAQVRKMEQDQEGQRWHLPNFSFIRNPLWWAIGGVVLLTAGAFATTIYSIEQQRQSQYEQGLEAGRNGAPVWEGPYVRKREDGTVYIVGTDSPAVFWLKGWVEAQGEAKK
jgi:hypothetical protein